MAMSVIKLNAISEVIEREGGDRYTDRPTDLGGPTRYGVTQAKAKDALGYEGDMRDFTHDLAVKVYEIIWDKLRCSEIEKRCPELAVWVFDFGVNSGEYRSAKAFQYLLNVLNYRQKLYADIIDDGIIGRRSLEALDAFIKHRGSEGLRIFGEAFNSERMTHCVNLARKRESQETNIYGWLRRISGIHHRVMQVDILG